MLLNFQSGHSLLLSAQGTLLGAWIPALGYRRRSDLKGQDFTKACSFAGYDCPEVTLSEMTALLGPLIYQPI